MQSFDSIHDFVKRLILDPSDEELRSIFITKTKRHNISITDLIETLYPIKEDKDAYADILFKIVPKRFNLQIESLCARIFNNVSVNRTGQEDIRAILDGNQLVGIRPYNISFEDQKKVYPYFYFKNAIIPVCLTNVDINLNNDPLFHFVLENQINSSRFALNIREYNYFTYLPGAYSEFIRQNSEDSTFL